MTVSINGTSGVTFPDASVQNTAATGFGFKNRIINGQMAIWQRGTSGFTTPNNYSADRWLVWGGVSLSAVGQSTDVPSGYKYSLSVSGTNNPQSLQRIESVNCTDLAGNSVTVSFWAKQTSGAGANSLALNLYYANATDNFSSVTSISSNLFTGTTGWVQYTATITGLPSGVANGLQVLIYANTTGAATFLITGVQLEKSPTATSFDYRPYGTELALCQRYYEKSYDQSVIPGTASTAGLAGGYCYIGSAASNIAPSTRFKVTKRATPSISYWDNAGTANITSDYSNGWVPGAGVGASAGPVGIGLDGFSLFVNQTSHANAYFHYIASAEL